MAAPLLLWFVRCRACGDFPITLFDVTFLLFALFVSFVTFCGSDCGAFPFCSSRCGLVGSVGRLRGVAARVPFFVAWFATFWITLALLPLRYRSTFDCCCSRFVRCCSPGVVYTTFVAFVYTGCLLPLRYLPRGATFHWSERLPRCRFVTAVAAPPLPCHPVYVYYYVCCCLHPHLLAAARRCFTAARCGVVLVVRVSHCWWWCCSHFTIYRAYGRWFVSVMHGLLPVPCYRRGPAAVKIWNVCLHAVAACAPRRQTC